MTGNALFTGLQVHTLCIDGRFNGLQTIKLVVQKRDAQTMLEVYDVAEMVAKGRRPVSMPGEGDLYMGGMG